MTDRKEAIDRLIAQDADLIDLPIQTDAIERALCEANGCVWNLDPDSNSRQQWRKDVAIVLAALKESK
jgi:hypothetical protein